MIAGVFIDLFTINGLTPARQALGDYVPGAGLTFAISDSIDSDDTWLAHERRTYSARVQVLVRHDNAPLAFDAAEAARALVEASPGGVFTWTNPVTFAERQYRILSVFRMNGPQHIPSPATDGSIYAANYEITVEDIP